MTAVERALGVMARAQSRRPHTLILAASLFTALMLVAVPNIRVEGDINKQMPRDLPEVIRQSRVSNRFGGSDTVFVAIQLDESFDTASPITDIRDPRVLEYIIELDERFSGETAISSVISLALLFKQTGVPQTLEQSKAYIKAFSQVEGLFSEDKTVALMFLNADIGSDPEKIASVTEKLEDIVDTTSKPAGIKTSVTGTPQIIITIVDLLQSDALFTLAAAIVAIFILLVLLYRLEGILIIIPLVLGVIWMFGSLGWLGISLSFATAGVGAVIVGLGVEYGVFYVKRFKEGINEGMSPEDALENAVPKVGSAITGSSVTTIAGFLALATASIPMLQNLGYTLALGIFYSVLAALVFNPAIALCLERGCFERVMIVPEHKDDKKVC